MKRRPAQPRPPQPFLPRPAIGYVRVSREEQAREGVSLETQRARITAYAEAKNLLLAAVCADGGWSGGDLRRPGFRELRRRCADGEIGHVIVWRLDRLTRCTRDLLNLVDDLFLARRIELHSVSESLDTATPHGRFVLTLFGGLAQMEREVIAERTRTALAWKRDHGLPTSHAPFGFQAVGRRTRMVPIPAEVDVAHRILQRWRAGDSYRAIATALNRDAVPTKLGARWHHTTVAKVVAARQRYARLGTAVGS